MPHMIVEQTRQYPMRMEYHPVTKQFFETEYRSLLFERGISYPYGRIKESGTPPLPHRDCILITEDKEQFRLGDEIEVKVIGVHKRADSDHKYVVVESRRKIEDICELSETERNELFRLYPMIRGWFGKEVAEDCMRKNVKAL